MKSTVEKMESDMQLLSQNMGRIDSLCGAIDAKMAPRRDKIDELSGVFRLLQGRQFLFELPSRLRNDLNRGQYADAVKYYLLTMDVLKSYEHLPSFGAINEECKATIGELRTRLWERVEAPGKTDDAAFVEAVGLLVDLHGEQKKLRLLFGQHSQLRFEQSLKVESPRSCSLFSLTACFTSGQRDGRRVGSLCCCAAGGGVDRVRLCLLFRGPSCAHVDRGGRSQARAPRDARAICRCVLCGGSRRGISASFVKVVLSQVQRLLGETNDVSEVVAGISNMANSLSDALTNLPVRFGEQKVSFLLLLFFF